MSAEIPHLPDMAWRAGAEEPPIDLLAGLRNGTWLDAQRFPPLEYAVPGLIAEGFVLLAGAPKIGKSWCVLDACLAVAAGGSAFGAIPIGPPRPVLYLALEDGDRRLQDRCRRLLGSATAIPPRFEYLTVVAPGRVVDTIAEWLEEHRGQRPLVVLDTFGKACPPCLNGESPYARDYRVGSTLKRIVDAHPGATLLVNHHSRKAPVGDFVDAVSGTQGLAGAADAVLILTRPREAAEGLLQVTGRDVPEGEYAMRFVDGSAWVLEGASLRDAAAAARQRRATAGLGDRSAEILELVHERPDGISPAEVGIKLGLDGDTAGQYLRRLAKAGRLERTGRGRYRSPLPTPPVRSVRMSESQPDEEAPFGHPTDHVSESGDDEECL